MNLKKNLVFLGMMGSGKSTIGALVSKKLNLNFIDIDKLIEKNCNMSISKIFSNNGEIFFRELEEKITLKNLNLKKKVISIGGGGFMNQKIRNEVLSNNKSIWLYWDSNTLIDRIKDSKKRPLVKKLNKIELLNLITKRSKLYAKADHKINCNKLTKSEIVDQIIKLIL
tara:strand:+ start:257 stop:763 length:507 start_codon:yes stop_codon:yes gene_type:complete